MATLTHVAQLTAGAVGANGPIVGLETFGVNGGGPLLQGHSGSGAVRATWTLGQGAAEGAAAHAPGDALGIDRAKLAMSGVTYTLTDDQLARVIEAGTLTVALDSNAFTPMRAETAWIATEGGGWLCVEDPAGGVAVFSVSDAALSGTGRLSLSPVAQVASAALDDLHHVTAGGADYLIGASALDDSITVWKLGETGTLTETGTAAPGLGIADPVALAHVTVEGADFIVAAGAGSGSLSVFALTGAGGLMMTDHVLDDSRETRFANACFVETVEMDGRAYILAAGTDGGISVLTMLPNGKLVHLASFADTTETSLSSISALAAVAVDGQIQIFAASDTEAGVSQFLFDPGQAGRTRAGGSGDDAINGGRDDDILYGGAGHDTLAGIDGDDILVDGAGFDWLTGGAGADLFVLTADGARDVIRDYTPGEDRLDLSDFDMLYSLDQLEIESTSNGAVLTWRGEETVVRSADGTPLTRADFSDATILNLNRPPSGIWTEQVRLEGTEADDHLLADRAGQQLVGLGGSDVLCSLGGTNLLDGGDGADWADYSTAASAVTADLALGRAQLDSGWLDELVAIENLEGSDFDDLLAGDGGANELRGGAGMDSLQGGAGRDTLYGNTAADLLEGGAGSDMLFGGAGIDTLRGGEGNDELVGNTATDHLYGEGGQDTLHGSEGRDRLWGGPDDDLLFGRTGADTLDGEDGDDSLYGSQGSDVLSGGAGADYLFGATGADLLNGGAGDDTLVGSQGYDTLKGGGGNDLLSGGSLADQLDGGRGNDTMTGGGGADSFVFRDGAGADVITDFTCAEDSLRLESGLWSGTRDAAGVVEDFATRDGGDIVLDFGGGDTLRLEGLADLGALAQSLEIF